MIWRSRSVNVVSALSATALCSRVSFAQVKAAATAADLSQPRARPASELRELRILRNDAVAFGRSCHNQFAVFIRCGEKDQSRGKILGTDDGENFRPRSRQELKRQELRCPARTSAAPRCNSHHHCTRNNAEVAVGAKQAAQPLQNDRMPVCDHYAGTTHRAVLSLSPNNLNPTRPCLFHCQPKRVRDKFPTMQRI